jgi:hypothetical protein
MTKKEKDFVWSALILIGCFICATISGIIAVIINFIKN